MLVNLLFLQEFRAVVIYIQFSLLLCSLLTVLGVIVLRWTHPELAAAIPRLGLSTAAAHFRRHHGLDDDLSLASQPD